MDETHRELLLKRQKYLRENVIMEEGLLLKLKEKGVFTGTMISIIQVCRELVILGQTNITINKRHNPQKIQQSFCFKIFNNNS